MKQAVILAGGMGTRLEGRLDGLPKPLVMVADKPLLERQICQLREYGYTNIVVLASYKAELIRAFCSRPLFEELDISVLDEGDPLGTAGALLRVIDQLYENFLVIYGDTLFDINIHAFERCHAQNLGVTGTVFVHPNDHPFDSDLVELDERGFVRKIHLRPHLSDRWYPNLVNAAFYLFNRQLLSNYKSELVSGDIAKDLFPIIISRGDKLLAYRSAEYIKDIGTPERLDRGVEHLCSGVVASSNSAVPQSAVFLDRDGVLNELGKPYVTSPDELFVYDFVGPAINVLNNSNWRTIVITNQPVIARGDCSLTELNTIHNKLETVISESGAYLDQIYFCPHHPDSGFSGEIKKLKFRCECRKPNTGLILNAIRDFNIAPLRSWFVGDSTSDLLAAKRMGISSILVSTGQGGRDGACSVQTEFSAKSLKEAVEFVIRDYPRIVKSCESFIDIVGTKSHWFISGLSRSGKSTVANVVRRELMLTGRRAHVLSLDRWLLPIGERGSNVFERYSMTEILRIFKQISAVKETGELKVYLPNYDIISRGPHLSLEEINFKVGDLVLWEGVVAQKVAELVGEPKSTLHVSCDESLRISRFRSFYSQRGLTDPEIYALEKSRDLDEVSHLAVLSKAAQIRIDL